MNMHIFMNSFGNRSIAVDPNIKVMDLHLAVADPRLEVVDLK